ncbi:MAG: GNAT family N-acetyltransferase [Solirubrobacterales bacterium]|nr:GNAT family N-acetyltransferase [Solirubrobacterales bacterium]
MSLVIRPAEAGDADAIAVLLGELGYPSRAAEARDRLERLLADADAGVLVAEAGGRAIGVAAYDLVWTLHRSAPQCRITTAVIDSGQRRRGVGRALIDAIESLARERGCFRLEVTTRPSRTDAVAFYASLGFEDRPHRFAKALRLPSP